MQPEYLSSFTNYHLLSLPSDTLRPLVGRETDLKSLLDRWYITLEQRSLNSLLIVGSPGIGKSCLLHTFLHQIHSSPEPFALLFVATSPSTMLRPYDLLTHLLAPCFKLESHDTPSIAEAKIAAVVTHYLGDGATAIAKVISSCMGYTVLPQSSTVSATQEEASEQQRIWDAVTQFLLSYASQIPMVLVVDDLQWADEASHAFLRQFVAISRLAPIYVVVATRPNLSEHTTIWQQPLDHLQQHYLQHLTNEASYRFVTELLKPTPRVPPNLIKILTERAEGHPFYLTALIQMLMADGIIDTSTREWQIRPQSLTQLRVPETLTAVIQARLDTLPSEERHLLEQAAVIGRTFVDTALVAMEQSSDTQAPQKQCLTSIHERLRTLTHKGFVLYCEQSTPQTVQTYRFHHDLLHEVIYESIPSKARQHYHLAIAQWLIREYSHQLDDYAGQIAEHYEKGQSPVEAAQWYMQAGKYAHDRYALSTATAWYQRALDLLPDTPQHYHQHISLSIELGTLLQNQSCYPEAEALYMELRELAEHTNDVAMQAHACTELASIYRLSEKYQQALTYAEQGEKLAAHVHEDVTRIRALIIKGRTLIHFGEHQEAQEAAEHALALSTAQDLQAELAASLRLVGTICTYKNDYDQANRYEAQALQMYRRLGDQFGIAIMLNNQACTGWVQGKFSHSIALLEEALELTNSLGHHELEILTLKNLAGLHNDAENYVEAETYARRTMHLNMLYAQAASAMSHFTLACALLGQQKVNEALPEAQHALELAQASGEEIALAESWRVLGMIMAQLPDHIGARPCFAESERLFVSTRSDVGQAETLREWARYELTKGDATHGKALWQQAYDIFARLGLADDLERMQRIKPD